jgi:hypothetical protein
MDTPQLASTNGPPARPKNRAWVWYFVILIVLTIAATTTLFVFNIKQQLTPEQLAAATALWKAKGPASYDMEYTKQLGTEEEKYFVEVRKGEVVSVKMNDQPIEERLYRYHSMLALFSFIEQFQKIDREPGRPRAFVRADFDATDGHIQRYVRSVSGTRERVQIVVTKFGIRD